MSEYEKKTGDESTHDASPAELDRWKRLMNDLPDARLEKVEATRSLVQRNGYDNQRIIDETVRRLSEELGIAHLTEDSGERLHES